LKQKEALAGKNLVLTDILQKKEVEVNSLVSKINETIREYEAKLEAKEEALTLANENLAEEIRKKNQDQVSQEALMVLERKFTFKEKELNKEIEELKYLSNVKEETIASLSYKLSQMSSQLFEPRMERLKNTEKEMLENVEKLLIIQESMEISFLCLRCLNVLKVPMTFLPCNHTFCEECREDIKEECFQKDICAECNTKPVHVFKNTLLDCLRIKFEELKAQSEEFSKWSQEVKKLFND
jgi:hypothetical protein